MLDHFNVTIVLNADYVIETVISFVTRHINPEQDTLVRLIFLLLFENEIIINHILNPLNLKDLDPYTVPVQ